MPDTTGISNLPQQPQLSAVCYGRMCRPQADVYVSASSAALAMVAGRPQQLRCGSQVPLHSSTENRPSGLVSATALSLTHSLTDSVCRDVGRRQFHWRPEDASRPGLFLRSAANAICEAQRAVLVRAIVQSMFPVSRHCTTQCSSEHHDSFQKLGQAAGLL